MTALPTPNPDETKLPPLPRRDSSRQPNSQPPKVGTLPILVPVAGSNVGSDIPMVHANDHCAAGMLLFDPLLSTLASGLDDVESVRISQENRYRQLTRTGEDKDGEERGFELDANHPAVAALDVQLRTLVDLDKGMAKALARQLRSHPLYPWVKGQCGLGDKQVARLLAAIRDPYWNDLHDRPRTVSELWAFCGLHVLPASYQVHAAQILVAGGATLPASQITFDAQARDAGGNQAGGDTGHAGLDDHTNSSGVAPRRRRGQKANWSTDAKTRTYLIAESCMKNRRSPYRVVYDDGRAKYAEAIHAVACAPCSALQGAPLRDGHKHARAMRLVMKAVLKDLWIESRRQYELASSVRAVPGESAAARKRSAVGT